MNLRSRHTEQQVGIRRRLKTLVAGVVIIIFAAVLRQKCANQTFRPRGAIFTVHHHHHHHQRPILWLKSPRETFQRLGGSRMWASNAEFMAPSGSGEPLAQRPPD